MNDRLGRVQALQQLNKQTPSYRNDRADGFLETIEPLALRFVARIDEPAIGFTRTTGPR